MFCNRAVCALLIVDNKILVVTRRNSDNFGLVGGKVDPGENEEAALRREILEECGLVINKAFPIYTDICGPGSDSKSFMTTTFFLYGDIDLSTIREIETGIKPIWIDINEFSSHENNVFKEYNNNVFNSYVAMIDNLKYLKG